jgi:hypothetical protein
MEEKEPHFVAPLMTHKGMWRIYSNPDPLRVREREREMG